MRIGNREFEFGKKTYIMGILNVTPDSFSDGGKFNQKEQAIAHAKKMIEAGVDIIDIGGESTRPNYTKISDQEEIERIVPVIKAIKETFHVPISVDTYKSQVAKAAIEAGGDLINDIWGLKYDEQMAHIIKEYHVPVCIMHNRNNIDYDDFRKDIIKDINQSLRIAKQAGIDSDKIILDPGVGFAKTYEMNLQAIKYLDDLIELGYPVLLGTSRKSAIGLALELPVTEREEGTIATTVIGAMKGCHFVRVHDVKANARALRMTEKILEQ